MKKYSYVTFEQRRQLERMHNAGMRTTDIAVCLKRSNAAIYDELKRGYTGELDSFSRPKYSAVLGQKIAQENIRRRGNRTKTK